jgi:O-antigen/teichoic acid export membrane protein
LEPFVAELKPVRYDMTKPTPSLTQRTAAGMAWLTGVQIARQVLSVISVSVLARRIPPPIYGLVGMAVLVTTLLETIRDVGTGTALIRERELPDELASTAFWLNCCTGIVVTLLVIAMSWPAAYFFRQPQVARILQFLSVSFFFGALGVVPTAVLNRAMQFRKVAVAQTTGAVCGTASAIAIALAGGKVSALVAASLVMSFVTTVTVWILSPMRVRAVFNVADARRILSFGLHLTGSHVMNYFSRNADNVLVGRYLGSAPLGYYQMGYMLMQMPLYNFTNMLAQVTYPALSRFHEDHARFRAAYLRTSSLISLVTFPLMLGLGVTAQPFVRVFLGPKWLPVATLLMVFGPLGALQSLTGTLNLVFNTQGRTDLLFRWQIFASICYVGSFVVGLRWGILGVAISYSIVWTLLMVPMFAIPFRLVGLSLRDFVRALWPTAWCSLVMTAVAIAWLIGLARLGIHNAMIQLVSTVAIGAGVYIALVMWQRPPVLSDLVMALEGTSNPVARAVLRFLPGSTRSKEALSPAQAASSKVL